MQQPLCSEVRQDSREHGEYSASLLHQLAKQGLELSEESRELCPEIYRLGATRWEYEAGRGLGGGTGGWVWGRGGKW
jgi:hypothetical protein